MKAADVQAQTMVHSTHGHSHAELSIFILQSLLVCTLHIAVWTEYVKFGLAVEYDLDPKVGVLINAFFC